MEVNDQPFKTPPVAADHPYSSASRNTAKKKLKSTKGQKSHRNCCVPHCTKHGYHDVEGHGKVSYFKIPTKPDMRKRWIAKIRREDENFQIKHHTFVCSQHFQDGDYEYSQFAGRRFLNADAVPSLFKCWENVQSRHLVKISKPRKAYRLQQNRTTAAEPSHNSDSESDPDMTKLVGDTPSMEPDAPSDGLSDELEDISCENESANIMSNEEVLQGKLADKELQRKVLQENVRSLTQELEAVKLELKQCEFGIENVRSSDIVFFTGFPSIEVFDQMLTYLNPGENGENVIMANQESQASTPASSSKRGRPRKLTPRNQFFLYLCRVRLGLLELDLSYRFRISLSSVSKIIITWANFVYLRLGSLSIWPTKAQILKSMPETFIQKYPDTRVIIDACEIKLEMPSSLVLKSQSYSNYKSCNTLKGLIGISPAGNLSFVSQLYTGSISDKELTIRSGILQLPFERGDSLMADKGFDIQDLLDRIGVRLNIPPFLGRNDQMLADDVSSTQSIAAERIHVERSINKVKNFHIFDQVIPLSLAGTINQIWTGCALLSLFQNPIISCTDPADDERL